MHGAPTEDEFLGEITKLRKSVVELGKKINLNGTPKEEASEIQQTIDGVRKTLRGLIATDQIINEVVHGKFYTSNRISKLVQQCNEISRLNITKPEGAQRLRQLLGEIPNGLDDYYNELHNDIGIIIGKANEIRRRVLLYISGTQLRAGELSRFFEHLKRIAGLSDLSEISALLPEIQQHMQTLPNIAQNLNQGETSVAYLQKIFSVNLQSAEKGFSKAKNQFVKIQDALNQLLYTLRAAGGNLKKDSIGFSVQKELTAVADALTTLTEALDDIDKEELRKLQFEKLPLRFVKV